MDDDSILTRYVSSQGTQTALTATSTAPETIPAEGGGGGGDVRDSVPIAMAKRRSVTFSPYVAKYPVVSGVQDTDIIEADALSCRSMKGDMGMGYFLLRRELHCDH
jgi:hypothetical protein